MSVKILDPDVFVGLKDAVSPEGSPEAVKATLLLKPFTGTTEIVEDELEPAPSERLFGELESVKLGVGIVS